MQKRTTKTRIDGWGLRSGEYIQWEPARQYINRLNNRPICMRSFKNRRPGTIASHVRRADARTIDFFCFFFASLYHCRCQQGMKRGPVSPVFLGAPFRRRRKRKGAASVEPFLALYDSVPKREGYRFFFPRRRKISAEKRRGRLKNKGSGQTSKRKKAVR